MTFAYNSVIIVSACLAGVRCRYDGGTSPHPEVIRQVATGRAIPLCPEQLGGLPTPRIPAEQRGDKVFAQDGRDVTHLFWSGAQEALKIARLVHCREAILKARSPSCGYGEIYDGSFSGRLIQGEGIFTAMLRKDGVRIFSDEDITVVPSSR